MSSALYNLFEKKFDRVYILNLANRKDRRDNIENQLSYMGFEMPDTNKFIRYQFAVPFPYNYLIATAFNESDKGQFTKPNEFDCARNHYTIVKSAYELGYENILVLEDDILFLKDCEKIAESIMNIPEDADILQFGCFIADPRIMKVLEDYSTGNEYWVQLKDFGVWNLSMTAYSRRGMEYYIACMDRKFWVADGPTYLAPANHRLVNTYLSRKPVVIQADKKKMYSDIRNEQTDSIDYNTMNLYERNINLNDYHSIVL